MRRISALLVSAFTLSTNAFAQPVVVVQDFGEAPREQIRYQFTAGSTETATMSMRMQMSMGGQQMPGIAIPAINVPMTLRTTEVRGDGTARYEFETSAASIDGGSGANPALEQALASSLGQIDELSGWYRIDARGNILESSFALPTGAPAGMPVQAGQMLNEMQAQMQQISAPFPVEAVGIGARWQVSSTAVMMGTPIALNMEYTLLARDGDRVELGLKALETVTAPAAGAPGIPPAAQAAPAAMEATATGKMIIDVNRMVPQQEMTTTTSMSSAMPTSGQGQSMAMSMQMTMSITPD
jgi:hypothetical protein